MDDRIKRVAFQGVPGAYSEAAAYTLCGKNILPIAFETFEQCFIALQEDEADYAMLPIENNRGGTVIDNHDLQLRYNFYICAELNYRVRHCLLALPGTKQTEIKMVLSHPQALAQCDSFLRQKKYQSQKEFDTAGSAKKIAEENLRGYAAIASKLAAEHYGLEIVKENIEDDSSNTTRFLLLSKQNLTLGSDVERDPKAISVNMKTSIVFSLEDVTGALFRGLAAFSLRDIFATKLESRPDTFRKSGHFLLPEMQESALYMGMPKNPELQTKDFSVVFYVDIVGSVFDIPVINAIKQLAEFSPFMRILGSYTAKGKLDKRLAIDFKLSDHDLDRAIVGKPKRKLKIGIVGFGNYGQFLAKTFVKYATVSACNRTDYRKVANELGVKYYANAAELLTQENGVDILVISVAILAFEKVLRTLPMHLLKNVLLVDVLSVKVFPKLTMLEILPEEAGILCTHPMFGPESGKHSWRGLPFVHDKIRIVENDVSNCDYDMGEVCSLFLDIFSAEGCMMVDMSCETHDRQAADSQFITHFIGRAIARLNLPPTGIATKGFQALLTLRDNTMKDSYNLFSALYLYNPNAEASLAKIKAAVKDLSDQLRDSEPAMRTVNTKVKNDMRLSQFVNSIKPSKTSEVFSLAVEMKRQGKDILSTLTVGEPDFLPPKQILDAAVDAVQKGITRYTPVPGTFDLRKAVSEDLGQRKGIKCDPNSEILIVPGGKQAIFLAIMALCEDGDEVIIPSPYWVSYPEIVRLSKAKPVFLQTNPHNGYIFSGIELASVLTPRTRMIVLCNPSNPTGALMEKEHLEEMASILRRPEYAHIYILADEIYERLVYDGKTHVSFAALEGMERRTLTVNGFSKAYAMTGFRLGYLVAPAPIIKASTKLQSQINSTANSISQYAAVEALKLPQEVLIQLYKELDEKRKYVINRLNNIPKVTCPSVSGAFYAFPDISAYFGQNVRTPGGMTILNSTDLCKYLIDQHGLALPPGDAFGAPYGVRLSYAACMEDLKEALDRLERGFSQLIIS